MIGRVDYSDKKVGPKRARTRGGLIVAESSPIPLAPHTHAPTRTRGYALTPWQGSRSTHIQGYSEAGALPQCAALIS